MQEKYGLPIAHEFDEREIIAYLESIPRQKMTRWERLKMRIKFWRK